METTQPPIVQTPDDCLNYVNRVGICAWRHQPKVAWMPSLERATEWRGMDLTMQTWFWKDDLHIERRLYFGMLLAPDVPVLVSLDFLPPLIAAQGDNDARTLFEQGRLTSNALRVYEHVARMGPTATQAMPWEKGSRMLYLALLQQKFLLTKVGLTGRTRRTYGYLWDRCETAFPDSFAQAARIAVPDARARVLSHLRGFGTDLTLAQAERLFRWTPL